MKELVYVVIGRKSGALLAAFESYDDAVNLVTNYLYKNEKYPLDYIEAVQLVRKKN